MIQRKSADRLSRLASEFKAVAVTGARQTGKTTLVKALFKDKPYVSLENPDMRSFATEDPRGFLGMYPDGAILDEVQRTPDIFSYLQEVLDKSKGKGVFILTGSNNFLLQQNISQSLAGRVAYMNLPPFSLGELEEAGLLPVSDDELMWKGFYPPVYDQSIPAEEWYPNYVQTYVERDVRQIRNINDLLVFERFLKLLAGRSGQELTHSTLAGEVGVDTKTIQSWLGILESSFIVHLLPSHHRNFNKTVIKRPKIYMQDTGLMCHLLGIRQPGQLSVHPLRGAVFETMVVNELLKSRIHQGETAGLSYWRDKTGHEIDILMEKEGRILPVEIKSGQTVGGEFFRNLRYWNRISGEEGSYVLYAGDSEQRRSDGCHVMPWRKGVGALGG